MLTKGIDCPNSNQVSVLPPQQMNGLVSYGFDNGPTLTPNLTYTEKITTTKPVAWLSPPNRGSISGPIVKAKTGVVCSAYPM